MKYNIAYCIEGFYNHGGMERILSVCANLLSDIYSITIIVANPKHGRAQCILEVTTYFA